MTPERALEERAKKLVDECHHTSFAKVDPVDRHGACDSCIAAFAAEYAEEATDRRLDELGAAMRSAGDDGTWPTGDGFVPSGEVRFRIRSLRAEITRLTLAASESARTLQVEIERLKQEKETWKMHAYDHGYQP